MFVRHVLQSRPQRQTCSCYVYRPDITFPCRGYDVGSNRRSDQAPNGLMRPHPYSETSFDDDSSVSESNKDKGNSSTPPDPPNPPPPPPNQASSTEPTFEQNSESRDVAVIRPRSSLDASSSPFSAPFHDAQDENVASRLANPLHSQLLHSDRERGFPQNSLQPNAHYERNAC